MTLIAGKYRVLRPIGKGSSGEVLLVENVDLGAKFALKLLSQRLSSDKQFIERFKQEADILTRFSHPRTVQMRDFGKTDDGHYYMTMDYCEGTLLKDLVSQFGRFQVTEALDVILQVLDVLEHAHRAGIVHRDIKPENIMVESMVDNNIKIKVLDFGIAKIKESMQLDSSQTIEGTSVGTPQYMSPEQAAGDRAIDHRADIYATGVLLYELLTGKVPFQGDSVMQTLLRHLTQPVPPIPAKFKVPERLQQIVYNAMEKSPAHRIQTAREFRSMCEQVHSQLLLGEETIPLVRPLERAGQGAHAVEDAATQAQEPQAEEPQPKEPTKILCLDDDPFMLNILTHILEQQGFKVYTASSFSVIHNYLFTENVELLISDVQMPGISGAKICQMLKQTIGKLKIVLFSNLPERDLEKLAAAAQADNWISKNTKPEEWLAGIKEVLERK